jgi:hypothetical protein
MKFNMPMAVFDGLALIAAAIAVPQIINVQVIPEAKASMTTDIYLAQIAGAVMGISACRN